MPTYTTTPYLGLVIEPGITATSRQNLYRIDNLASSLALTTNSGDTILSADNNIYLKTLSNLYLGTADEHLALLAISADSVTLHGTNTITGLVYDYTALDFTGSSITSIEDYDTVIASISQVAASTAHIAKRDNPHVVTAAQVGAYTTAQVDALLALLTTSSSFTGHTSSTSAHGTSSAIVGSSDSQTLTNKAIDAASNTITGLTNAAVSAIAAIAGTKIAPDFGAQDIETTGKLVLGNGSFSASIYASPSANYALTLPTTSGATGKFLYLASSTALDWATVPVPGFTLTEGSVIVGNSSSVGDDVDTATLGDIAASVAGGLTIKSGVIVNDDISVTAAIAVSKLATLTASRAVATTSGGILTPATTTAAELDFLSGVTSGVQSQLNGKQGADADLTAVAALAGPGFAVKTSTDPATVTWANRTIVGTTSRVSVSNGDGVLGNPTINLDTSLLPSPVIGDIGKLLIATGADAASWTTQSKGSISTTTSGVTIGSGTDSTVGPNVTVDVASAGAAAAGLVTTGTQTFGGLKTFNLPITVNNSSASGVTGVATQINTVNPNTEGLIIKGASDPTVLPANITFLADYASAVTARYSAGDSAGTLTGSAAVTGGLLDCTTNPSSAYYSAVSNADSAQVGCIRMLVTPNYSGAPSALKTFFVIKNALTGSTTPSEFGMYHRNGTGAIVVNVRDSGNVAKIAADIGTWTPVSGTQYELEINYDFTTGATRVFIDGVQVGSTDTTTFTRASGDCQYLILASYDGATGYHGSYKFDNVAIFNAVQHTTGFASELPHLYGEQAANMFEVQNDTGAVLFSIGGQGLVTTGSVAFNTLTASRAIYTAANKALTSSPTTDVELGYLSGVTSAIQSQLGGKEPTLTKGNLTETTSSVLTITGGTGAVIGSGLTIQVKAAATAQSGYLSSTDWNRFDAAATFSKYAAALSWTGVGPYTMTITAATHGRGLNPVVRVRETVTGDSTDVMIDSITVTDATGDVTLTSSENITGKVVIL